MAGYTRNPTPQNYGGSYTPKEPKTPEEATKPKPFFLKEKISEMMKYGMPLVDTFPRRERKLADILRDSMLEMYRLTMHQREVWSSFNKEIGCMIGGYIESVKNGPAKKA